jgi:hypothetical protein
MAGHVEGEIKCCLVNLHWGHQSVSPREISPRRESINRRKMISWAAIDNVCLYKLIPSYSAHPYVSVDTESCQTVSSSKSQSLAAGSWYYPVSQVDEASALWDPHWRINRFTEFEPPEYKVSFPMISPWFACKILLAHPIKSRLFPTPLLWDDSIRAVSRINWFKEFVPQERTVSIERNRLLVELDSIWKGTRRDDMQWWEYFPSDVDFRNQCFLVSASLTEFMEVCSHIQPILSSSTVFQSSNSTERNNWSCQSEYTQFQDVLP